MAGHCRMLAGTVLLVFLAALPAGAATKEERAKDAVSEGVSLYRKGDLWRARAAFRKALRLQPREKKAQRYLDRIDRRFEKTAADLLRLAEKTKNSTHKDLDRILKKVPDNPAAVRYLYRQMEQSVKGSTAAASMEDLIWLLERRPALGAPPSETRDQQDLLKKQLNEDRGRRVYATASALLDRGRWEDAIRLLEGIVANEPGNAAAAQLLEKARARYAREVSQKVDSLYREAAELYAKGDYARSAELLEELLRIQPRHLEAVRYLNKIRTLQGEKDTDEAATD